MSQPVELTDAERAAVFHALAKINNPAGATALLLTVERLIAAWVAGAVGDAQATENALVQQVVERERDRAHAAEQSLGEADAEIERLKAIVARVEALIYEGGETCLSEADYGPDAPTFVAVRVEDIRAALDPS